MLRTTHTNCRHASVRHLPAYSPHLPAPPYQVSGGVEYPSGVRQRPPGPLAEASMEAMLWLALKQVIREHVRVV